MCFADKSVTPYFGIFHNGKERGGGISRLGDSWSAMHGKRDGMTFHSKCNKLQNSFLLTKFADNSQIKVYIKYRSKI